MWTLTRRLPGTPVSAPVHAIGSTVFLLAVAHVVVDDDPPVPELAEASILLAFALAVFWVGYRVEVDGMAVDGTLRLVTVSLGAGLVVGVLATTFVVTRLMSGEPITEGYFVVSIGWSIGVAGGALVAYHVERVERSVERQAGLAKRLTILQRVLRHNLRNELTIIGGATDDALDRVEDPDVEEKLRVIERHARLVLELSEKSQRLTRIWRTETTVTLDAGEVARGEVERFRSAFPDVPVAAEIPAGTPVRVHPDIRLAVREALENAAIHNDGVEVSVAVRGPGPDEPYATIEVRDTGSGVPESELDPLWAAGEGPLEHTTGLGLWLIYWLVESSGGKLGVEVDGGTTVSMRLPVD